MSRFGGAFWFILVIATGMTNFLVKQTVQGLDDQLAQVKRKTAEDQKKIHDLVADWTFLNQPELLSDLNNRYVHLAPMSPKQIVTNLDSIPMRPAPPAPPEEAPPAVAEVSAPAATPAAAPPPPMAMAAAAAPAPLPATAAAPATPAAAPEVISLSAPEPGMLPARPAPARPAVVAAATPGVPRDSSTTPLSFISVAHAATPAISVAHAATPVRPQPAPAPPSLDSIFAQVAGKN